MPVPSLPQASTDKPATPWSPGAPQWLLLALVATVAMHVFLPLARIVPREGFWAGVAMLLLGGALANVAAIRLRNVGSSLGSDRPRALLIDGPFAASRHPVYLGMLLLLAGEAVMLGTLGALLPWPAFFLALHHGVVPAEERGLAALFGDDWSAYRRRVRRWF